MFNPLTILNPNGEKISANSLNFIIKDKDKVIEKLDKIPDFERNEGNELFWAFKEPRKKKKPIEGQVITSTDNIFLGDLQIKDNKLLCNTMTKPASEKLLKILQDNLGDLISMAVIEHEDIFDTSKPKKSKKQNKEDFQIPADVQEGIYKDFFDQHLRKSLDEKIPILNNKTPRQCVKSDPKRVLKWLEMMEQNTKEQIPGGNYDMSWVYNELGLND